MANVFESKSNYQSFLATRERPELNPELSALIGEDIRQSIAAKKRKIDRAEQLISSSGGPTTYRPQTLTTTTERYNDGLVDQSISLDAAGTENKQVSKH